tara:strand:- start:261 stop:437 length:177 start_codon:yes stop_codon:yes gene_type:complete
METLNLGSAIAQMKVLKWQYDEIEDKIARQEVIVNILNLIDEIEVPQLIANPEEDFFL